MRTLPELAALWNVNVHCVRTFLRRHRPDLLSLGQKLGPTIGWNEDAAEAIREAFENRPRPATAATG